MENENLFNHNNETGDPTKKENSMESSGQSGEILDGHGPLSDDDYLKNVMEPDTSIKVETGKSQAPMGGTRRSKSPGLT